MDEIYDFFGIAKDKFLQNKKINISKKLNLVAKECGNMDINLTGRYKNDAKKIYFNYLTIEDLLALLNTVLTKNNLFIKIYTKVVDSAPPVAEKSPYSVHLIVYILIRDIDSGETEIFAEHGFGIEYGKPAYTKAINSALRLLWRNNLCLRYGTENKQSTAPNPATQDSKKPSKNNSQTKNITTLKHRENSKKITNSAASPINDAVQTNTEISDDDKIVKIDDKLMTLLMTKYKYFSRISDDEFEKDYLSPRGLSLNTMCELTMAQGRDIINELKKGNAISA